MKAPITFEPSGVTVWVEPGTTVHQAALVAGVPVSVPCGGRGVCGACGVRVLDGSLAEPDDTERRAIERGRGGVRLACRAQVEGRVTVQPVIALRSESSTDRTLPAAARTVVGVDLGTTSVSAVAVDLEAGVEGPVATVPNLQSASGADVLSRIAAAVHDSAVLRDAAMLSVTRAIGSALNGVEQPPDAVVIAGNTAMEALLAGSDVTGLGAYPFVAPDIPLVIDLDDGELQARMMPVIGGFIGGDTVACLLHTGMVDSDATTLLVDLGTNAEIALAARGSLWVASAAAGPAFEGFGIECGGAAAPGSVLSAVWSDAHGWRLKVLGDEAAARLAGSGLVSAVALLRRLGHIAPDGRMTPEGPLADAFFTGEDGVLRVSVGAERAVTLSQLDVRALQLAKAAVQVGIAQVLAAAGVTADELDDVYVAGAFGSGLAAADIVELGIVPASAREKVRAVGNASLYGALAAAVTPALVEDAARIAAQAVHVELATDPKFQSALISALELAEFNL
ncbi:MAG TPA: ASKHA domain-containing protein [Coriobacteriia bacterium]|nr:ASKHA domain-containing protein [Coriobacteriia bacterium]